MASRTFIFPTDTNYFVLATFNELSFERLKAWLASFNKISESQPLDLMVYEGLPGAKFEVVSVHPDAKLDADTAELVDCVSNEGAVYQLATGLDPALYKVIESELDYVEVRSDGIALLFTLEDVQLLVEIVGWSEIGVENEDPRRCEFFDCIEAHPPAGRGELVTCHTCRGVMSASGKLEQN